MLSSLKEKKEVVASKDKVKKETNSRKMTQVSRVKVRGKKVVSSKEVRETEPSKGTKKEEKLQKEMSFFQKWVTKTNVTYFILILLDAILVIYSARQNIVNYVTVSDEKIFVSKTRYLLWGRNYINIIITAFFYFYTCLMNHFFLKRRNTKKFLGCLLIGLILFNVILFFVFTKRVY